MTRKRNRPAGVTGKRAGDSGGGASRLDYTTERGGCLNVMVRRPDGKIVGRIDGDILRKHARREHMLQRPAAWAWDSAILDAAEKDGARFTEVECDGLIYRASLSDFRRYGFPVNRGHGVQRGLPLAHWQIWRKGEAPPAVQLGLFEAAR